MEKKYHIAICGAGIAGLASALFLGRAKHSVIVLEAKENFDEIGYGLQLSPNAVCVLEALGLGQQCEYMGSPARAIEVSRRNGECLAKMDLTNCKAFYGAPYYHFFRSDLHRMLLTEVKSCPYISLHLGTYAKTITQKDQTIIMRLTTGDEIKADILLGADGAHSFVRETLLQKHNTYYWGKRYKRDERSKTREKNGEYKKHQRYKEHKEHKKYKKYKKYQENKRQNIIYQNQNPTHQSQNPTHQNQNLIHQNQAKSILRLVGRLEKPITHAKTKIFIGCGQHIVLYPLRDGRYVNFVGTSYNKIIEQKTMEQKIMEQKQTNNTEQHRANNTEQQSALAKPSSLDMLKHIFSDFQEPFHMMGKIKEVSPLSYWSVSSFPSLKHITKGRIALLGDSAHLMEPFIAQGAAMALEDAFIVSQSILQNSSPTKALLHYEHMRHNRVRKMRIYAKIYGALFHCKNPIMSALIQNGLSFIYKMDKHYLMRQQRWIYGFDVRNLKMKG